MQEVHHLMNVHVRRSVILIIENHQRLVVWLCPAHEIADLKLYIVAGIEMVGTPQKPELGSLFASDRVIRIKIGPPLTGFVDHAPDAISSHRLHVFDDVVVRDVDHSWNDDHVVFLMEKLSCLQYANDVIADDGGGDCSDRRTGPALHRPREGLRGSRKIRSSSAAKRLNTGIGARRVTARVSNYLRDRGAIRAGGSVGRQISR